jgi:hypothetical protein
VSIKQGKPSHMWYVNSLSSRWRKPISVAYFEHVCSKLIPVTNNFMNNQVRKYSLLICQHFILLSSNGPCYCATPCVVWTQCFASWRLVQSSEIIKMVLTSSLLHSPFDVRPQFNVPSLFQPTAVIVVDANEADTRWFWKWSSSYRVSCVVYREGRDYVMEVYLWLTSSPTYIHFIWLTLCWFTVIGHVNLHVRSGTSVQHVHCDITASSSIHNETKILKSSVMYLQVHRSQLM